MPKIGLFWYIVISFLVSLAAAYVASLFELPFIIDWMTSVSPSSWLDNTIIRWGAIVLVGLVVFLVLLIILTVLFVDVADGENEEDNAHGGSGEEAGRVLMSLHPVIIDCTRALSSLPNMSNEYTRTDRRDAHALKVEAQIEALAHDLDEIGVPTLPVRIFPIERKMAWLHFLQGLENYARDGKLEAAILFANQRKSEYEEEF